jgi:hypothetical protein
VAVVILRETVVILLGYSLKVLESARKLPGKFWKEICRKERFFFKFCAAVLEGCKKERASG